MTQEDYEDYEDLQHLAYKRDIKITIRKGAEAGLVAGLSVMFGVIVAGPVGAVVGGTVGTALAENMSRNVVSLYELLERTPVSGRRKVLKAFRESLQEEFMDMIVNNPELQFLMCRSSIFGVLRYLVDRDLLKRVRLESLDKILRRVV
jgi:hypothetical protein